MKKRLTLEEELEMASDKRASFWDYELSALIQNLEHIDSRWDEADDFISDCDDENDPRLSVAKEGVIFFQRAAEKLYEVL